jgi:hypothetical protein
VVPGRGVFKVETKSFILKDRVPMARWPTTPSRGVDLECHLLFDTVLQIAVATARRLSTAR